MSSNSPTQSQERKHFTLSTVLNRVKAILDEKIQGKSFWVKAEIANVNFHSSGHVYLELAESVNGKTVAKCKGIIWASNFRNIQTVLKEDTENIIKKGNEIMCRVSVDFDINYGLKILISDIDINFNLGQIERRRQETIDRLTKAGIIHNNKRLPVPTVIQKIAVIASTKTAGYSDFEKQLHNNPNGYHFDFQVFHSTVQGDQAIPEILNRLNQLDGKGYEVIVIIRGGGSKMDLDVFNSFDLAKRITEMKTPVFTGIGHETDICVADLVAHSNFKTPTAVANHFIEIAFNFDKRVLSAYDRIYHVYENRMERERNRISKSAEGIKSIAETKCGYRRGELHQVLNRINTKVREEINLSRNRVENIMASMGQESLNLIDSLMNELRNGKEMLELRVTSKIHNADRRLEVLIASITPYSPKLVLDKGFVIPRVNGVLYKGEKLPLGTEIELQFATRRIIVTYKDLNASYESRQTTRGSFLRRRS